MERHDARAQSGRERGDDAAPGGAGGGVPGARRAQGRGGRDRTGHRPCPGTGEQPLVRPGAAVRQRRGDGLGVGPAQQRPGEADAQPGGAPDLSAGFDVQGGHRGGGAGRGGGHRPGRAHRLPRPLPAARHPDPADQRGRRLRGHLAAGRLRVVLQHGLRQARRGRRGPRHEEHRGGVRVQRHGSAHPVLGGAQHLRLPGGQGPVGAVVDRAVQHAGHPAADGDGRGGRRRRRPAAHAVPGGADHPARGRDGLRRGDAPGPPGDAAVHGPAVEGPDDRRGPRGHRHPGGRPGRGRRRQDRHRPARGGQHRCAVRLVRLLGAGRRRGGAGGGGRRGGGGRLGGPRRDQRRRRRGPDRAGRDARGARPLRRGYRRRPGRSTVRP
ncbi:hypothetical protein SGPA1_11805 [Streptomyces misionensis JCM 4497]